MKIQTASLLLVLAGGLAASAPAQTPQQLQHAFAAIRADRVPNNCGDAVAFLYRNREKVKGDILDQLYRSDAQGKSALMYILYNTKSFQPDPKFLNLVLSALPTESPIHQGGGYDFPEEGTIENRWNYVDAHFDSFEPLLAAQVATKNVWLAWGVAWLYKKHGVLEKHAEVFTPAVFAAAAVNLRNDEVEYNASQAARLFLLTGDAGLPALREAAAAGDAQAKNLARALIDALTKGKRQAFAYLNSQLNLAYVLSGEEPTEPEWLTTMTAAYVEKENPSYP